MTDYKAHQPYLDQKQVPPSRVSAHSSEVEEAEAEKAGNDVGDRHSRPPETKPERKFTVLIEV